MEAAPRGGRAGKLIRGARVALFSPEWDRPCVLCVQFHFGDDGLIRRDRAGELWKRGDAPTPCLKCPKVPAQAKQTNRTPLELRKLADEMTPENRLAFERFREWRATGQFPDDPIVRWYSGPLGACFEEWHREPLERSTLATITLIKLLRAQR